MMSLSKLRLFHGRLNFFKHIKDLTPKNAIEDQGIRTLIRQNSTCCACQLQNFFQEKKLFENKKILISRYANYRYTCRTSVLTEIQHVLKPSLRFYNSDPKDSNKSPQANTNSNHINESNTTEPSPSVFSRFKNAYKEYGKVLIGVHVATSAVWFGCFFYAAKSGLDVVPLLEKIGASDTIIKPFKSSGVGNVAVAYLLYKLATPARYTVTIIGTQLTAKTLRNLGYMKVVPKEDSFRQLMKDSRTQIKEKTDILKEKTTSQLKETSSQWKQTRNKIKQNSKEN